MRLVVRSRPWWPISLSSSLKTVLLKLVGNTGCVLWDVFFKTECHACPASSCPILSKDLCIVNWLNATAEEAWILTESVQWLLKCLGHLYELVYSLLLTGVWGVPHFPPHMLVRFHRLQQEAHLDNFGSPLLVSWLASNLMRAPQYILSLLLPDQLAFWSMSPHLCFLSLEDNA